MARIRTVKPDFWTDEKLTECSLSARLFFIGLLNFSDDNGNLARSSKKLKMQIFPADTIDCEPLVQELLAQKVLIEYEAKGEKYLNIKGFKKHQIINRPSKSNIPEPPDSHTTHGVLTESSLTEGKGRERKGKEAEAPLPPEEKTPQPEAAAASIELIKIFDDVRVEVWGKEHSRLCPHPHDKTTADGWLKNGIKPNNCREYLAYEMKKMHAKNKPPPNTLAFFNNAISSMKTHVSAKSVAPQNTENVWVSRIRDWQTRKVWLDFWGDPPTSSKCQCPKEILQQHGLAA